jgi:hypothetical protein
MANRNRVPTQHTVVCARTAAWVLADAPQPVYTLKVKFRRGEWCDAYIDNPRNPEEWTAVNGTTPAQSNMIAGQVYTYFDAGGFPVLQRVR